MPVGKGTICKLTSKPLSANSCWAKRPKSSSPKALTTQGGGRGKQKWREPPLRRRRRGEDRKELHPYLQHTDYSYLVSLVCDCYAGYHSPSSSCFCGFSFCGVSFFGVSDCFSCCLVSFFCAGSVVFCFAGCCGLVLAGVFFVGVPFFCCFAGCCFAGSLAGCCSSSCFTGFSVFAGGSSG